MKLTHAPWPGGSPVKKACASELGPGKTVATVAVDTGLKYLAGDLFAG